MSKLTTFILSTKRKILLICDYIRQKYVMLYDGFISLDNKNIFYSIMIILIIVVLILVFIAFFLKRAITNNNEYIINKLNSYSATFNKNHIGDIGSWGEEKLSSTLNTAGFFEGTNFYRNKTFYLDGSAYRPDFVLVISNTVVLIIDVKTPWISYNKYLHAQDKNEQTQYLKEHANAIKRHIKDLSTKNYTRISDALPFVLMFIPIEDMFVEACKYEYDIMVLCKKYNIFITTPHTLYNMIMVITLLVSNGSFSKYSIKTKQDIEFMIDNLESVVDNLDAAVSNIQKRSKDMYYLRNLISEEFITKLKNIRDNNNKD